MRVFVAGATGVIGRPLVARLLAEGHEVSAIARGRERVEGLRRRGVAAEVCDVFDAERLRGVVERARPEVVVHQLTALPDRTDFRKRSTFAATSRLRREATPLLVDAARRAGARRFVCQSIAFAYAHDGGPVKTEEDSLLRDAPGPFGDAIAAVRDMEGTVLQAPGLEGMILRYGFLYGPGTTYDVGHGFAEDVRRRRVPIVGGGHGVFSFLHVDDAAAATLPALDRGAPGVYNVVDNEPAPMHEWLPVYAEAIGAPPPRRAPAWLGRLVAGRGAVAFATEMRGASNAKAKQELGWSPGWPSWRDGFARIEVAAAAA